MKRQPPPTIKSARVLHLNLHREHFARIIAGTKQVEYRRRTSHWDRRLDGRTYDVIQFRNGYAMLAPEMLVEFLGVRRCKKSGQPYYAIRLGRILKIKGWQHD